MSGEEAVSLEQAIRNLIKKDAKKMGYQLYYWQDARTILKMVGERVEKTRQILLPFDSFPEITLSYKDAKKVETWLKNLFVAHDRVLGLWAAKKEKQHK